MRCPTVGALFCFWLRHSDSTRVKVARGQNATKKVDALMLPSECQHCQSGIVDPFQPTRDYCYEHYDACKCCRSALEAEFLRICTSGKDGGGTFMGYGSCVAGIQHAIQQKEQQCEHQQAVADWNKNQQEQQINDALGSKSPYATNFTLAAATQAAGQNSTGYVVHRFSSECAGYGDPSCSEFKPLCAHGYGCNDQLHDFESDLDTVKDYYGMYQNTPCFH